MAIKLKQSTASQEIPLGYFLDSSDGDTEETGLTIANTDIKLWKMGATTLANKNSGGATHISNGVYYCTLDATDTNTLGALIIFVHVSGALAIRVECEVLPANVYDSWIAGSDYLQIDAVQWGGAAVGSMPAPLLPKNTALSKFSFTMYDSADHVTPKTGLTVTAEISKDGGAFAAVTDTVTAIANGVYEVDLTAGEMNADVVVLKFTASGADQQTITIVTSS